MASLFVSLVLLLLLLQVVKVTSTDRLFLETLPEDEHETSFWHLHPTMSAVNGAEIVTLTFALKQSNLKQLKVVTDRVSYPSSPDYGR
jgi:hypothetical protein